MRLTEPLTDSPLIGDLLDTERLTPVTRAYLEERGLEGVYRGDPAETISTLHEKMTADGAPEHRLAIGELCTDMGERLAEAEPRVALYT